MKIAFHDNCLCVRGTTTALWDYAEWCSKLFNIEPIILFNSQNPNNQSFVIDKFTKVYPTFGYKHPNEIDSIITDNKCDAFFMIKGGHKDGIISNVTENWINAISICNQQDIHGQKFAMGSKWLSKITNNTIDYVSYMVNLPKIEGNMRHELNIPDNAIVFGRNGGQETFDINFVKKAIEETLKIRKNIFFLFQGTNKFYEHENIIYLPPSSDVETKVKFINTCDALLHARDIGESFGLTCAEFSMLNKPVITWFGSRERNHIDYLGDKGIYYNNYDDILRILSTFEPNSSINWKCYEDCLPEVVMSKFEKFYLK